MIESGSVVPWDWGGGRSCKGVCRNFGGDRFTHYVNCGGGFMGIYTCQHAVYYYVNHTSIKQIKKYDEHHKPLEKLKFEQLNILNAGDSVSACTLLVDM